MSANRPGAARPRVQSATIGYDKPVISERLSVAIPEESCTVIVGPNACGKSTLLRGLSRLLKPSAGQIVLDGDDINLLKTKEVARRVGLLPQSAMASDGVTVADLVARGRYTHQGLIRQRTGDDERAVLRAMRQTAAADLSGRLGDELSGGQRGTHLIPMKDGAVVAEGTPHEVVTAELVEEVFGLRCLVTRDPVAGSPRVVPLGRERTRHRIADNTDAESAIHV